MMARVNRSIVRVLSWALPCRDRDAVLGDLLEEGRVDSFSPIRAAMVIAVHYQLEPYRDLDDRWRITTVALVGLGLLWLVPAASGQTFANPGFPDSFSRMVVAVWSASHVTSALAAGLFAGRSSIIPEHASTCRWHLALGLALVAAVSAPTATGGGTAALLTIISAWLGGQARPRIGEDRTTRA